MKNEVDLTVKTTISCGLAPSDEKGVIKVFCNYCRENATARAMYILFKCKCGRTSVSVGAVSN